MGKAPKKKSLRPVDAATMVLWRRRRNGTLEVLMGRRHRNHVFMPHAYVFPGGRVDPVDAALQPASALPADVQARLERAANPTRARAIAAGAVRETFEETGLLLAAELDPKHHTVVGFGCVEEWCRVHGMGVIHGGKNALRYTPHFNITSAEVDLIIELTRAAIQHFSARASQAAK